MLEHLDKQHRSFNFFEYPFSQEIWKMKYSNNGKDDDIYDTFKRVAKAISQAEGLDEKNDEKRIAIQETYARTFYDYMAAGLFMPAGRILAGAGTGKRVTLVNCFVNDTVKDSMKGIFRQLTETALTMQQGGGMGTDFSTIRPSGALIEKMQTPASGPLPFMDTWDAMCKTIMSAGSRRGAMMGTLICTHPDLLKFINAKHEKGILKNFNLSILITDKFMRAIENDLMWPLYFHEPPIWETDRPEEITTHDFVEEDGTVQYCYSVHTARDLWQIIMDSTYKYAEPGVIFIDEINDQNNLKYLEKICCTNPCGEQPLPPYGACNLGAVVLARMVQQPFTEGAFFDYQLLRNTVASAMLFLDNVIDITGYPLKEQEQEQIGKRRVGLGFTGLADVLIQLGLPYDSTEGRIIAKTIQKTIADAAYYASAQLAKTKGTFPLWNAEKFNRIFVERLEPVTNGAVESNGLRNGVLLTIAPTGTTSIVFGNVSSSLEPNFAFEYNRKVLQDDGTFLEHKVESFIQRFAAHCNYDPAKSEDKDAWVTSETMPVEAHLQMQKTLQKYVDASISKTINCPTDITFEAFKLIYMQAWRAGCKGCTTYRPSDVRDSVLSLTKEKMTIEQFTITDPGGEEEYDSLGYKSTNPKDRPDQLEGTTYKIRWPGLSSAIYMTINHTFDRMPFEVFFASKDNRYQEWTTALSLTLTSLFRLNIDPTFILKEFQQIVATNEIAWIEGKRFDSLISFIGYTLDRHINGTIAINEMNDEMSSLDSGLMQLDKGEKCSACGAYGVMEFAGCKTCTSCGDSKCG